MLNDTPRKTVNVDKPNLVPLWNFKEGDDAVLNISLFKECVSFDITGQIIRLGAKTSDGLKEQIDGFTIQENNLDIALKNTILVPGVVEIDLEFTDAGGKMTSASFFINVNSKVLNNTAVKATDEFDTFTKTVEEIQGDYQGLRTIMLDENNAASLQDQVNTVNAHLAENTQDIVNLKKDIGTTANIAELKAANNEATQKISDLDSKITQVGNISSTIKNVEDAKKDFNGSVKGSLPERLNSDMSNVMDRFNKASLLEYEDKYISASESFDGVTKDLKIKGRTIKNLIKNGDFSNGTTSWNKNVGNTLSALNNTLTISGDGTLNYFYAFQRFNEVVNHKYYSRAKIKANGVIPTSIALRRTVNNFELVSLPILNNWYALSGIYSAISNATDVAYNVRADYVNNADTITSTIDIQTYLIVDLTEMFGEGNEPTKEWCDANLPFIDGIQSVGEKDNKIEVLSVGKNWLDDKDYEQGGIAFLIGRNYYNSLSNTTLETRVRPRNLTKVNPNTIYTILIPNELRLSVQQYDNNMNGINDSGWFPISNNKTITTLPNCRYLSVYFSKADGVLPILAKEILGCQLEEGTLATPYEPYKQDKLSISLTEPLRGLPNGVKDEVDLENGKLVKKIPKVNLIGDNSFGWIKSNGYSNDNYTTFFAPIDNGKYLSLVLSDKFQTLSSASLGGVECIYGGGNEGKFALFISISNSRLSSLTVAGFKTWLQANPTTVYYELATPIETPLNLPKSLRTYDRTTHLFTTGSLVEPSVYCKIPSDVVSLTDIRHSTVKNKLFANADERVEEIEKDIKNIVTQEAWIRPTLLNGWLDYSTGLELKYFKNSLGVVTIIGRVKSGTLGLSIFLLPVGYRPSQQIITPVNSNNAFGSVVIEVGGFVFVNVGVNTSVNLNISFYAG